MARRFQSRVRRMPGPRRNTEWLALEYSGTENALPGASRVQIASLDATEKGKLPFTVTRTIGNLWVRSDQVAASEQVFGALGACIVNDAANTIGITALPDPVTDFASDVWFLYVPFAASFQFTGLTEQIYYRQFDSKAQRKVQEGEDIVFTIANAAGGGIGLEWNVQFRMLIKLH